MKKYILLAFSFILLKSCATLLNKNNSTIKISSDEEYDLVFQKDTFKINQIPTKIYPRRSKDSLKLTVYNDSLKENFSINRKLSLAFWLNIPYNHGLGMLVDLTNDKRFRYKNHLYFKTDSLSNNIILSDEKVTSITKKTFFIYTSPFQAIDVFSTPMLTLGGEYFVFDNISLSTEFGLKYTERLRDNSKINYINDKGYLLRSELKWYNGINLTNNMYLNEYLGLEYRFIYNQFNDQIDYYLNDGNESNELITDDFAAKKKVSVFNIKYGILVPLNNSLYFDFFSGFGLRIKDYEYIKLEYDKSLHYLDDNHEGFFYYSELQDSNPKFLFNYSLGFKFGVKF